MPAFANSEEFDVKWHNQYACEEACTSADKFAEARSAAIRARIGPVAFRVFRVDLLQGRV